MKVHLLSLLLALCFPTFAQEASFYLLSLDTQVHQNEQMIWRHDLEYSMQEDKPAVFKFSAENFKMLVRVTCHQVNDSDMLLTVQSETLMKSSEDRVNFFSNLKTIVMNFGDPVIYFPLGLNEHPSENEAVMQLLISLEPLKENSAGDQE